MNYNNKLGKTSDFDIRNFAHLLEPAKERGRYVCPVCGDDNFTFNDEAQYQCWSTRCDTVDIMKVLLSRSGQPFEPPPTKPKPKSHKDKNRAAVEATIEIEVHADHLALMVREGYHTPEQAGVEITSWAKEHGHDAFAASQLLRNKLQAIEQSNSKKRFQQTMEQVDAILKLESEAEQDWEGGLLARQVKAFTWSQLKSMHQKLRQGGKTFAPIDHDEFLAMTQEQRSWLIAGLVSTGTTIVNFADGGVGKTLLAYDLCKAIASGTDWNGFKTQQGKVLIIQTDEPEIDTRERLDIASFQDLPKGTVKIQTDWQFSQMRQLRDWIEQEQPAFVMIDSMTSANRAAIAGSEWDATYGTCLYELRDIANQHGCTCMVLHHENKGGGARGTTAIRNNVSEVWRLRKGEKPENLKPTQRILEIEKSRSGCNGTYQLELDPDDYSWKWQGDYGAPEEESNSIPQRIQDYLALNPNVKFELDELLAVQSLGGASRDSIRKHLERLRKKGIVESEFRTNDEAGKGGKRRYRVYFVQAKNGEVNSELSKQSENRSNPETENNLLNGHCLDKNPTCPSNNPSLLGQNKVVQPMSKQYDPVIEGNPLLGQKNLSSSDLKLDQVVQPILSLGDRCTYIGSVGTLGVVCGTKKLNVLSINEEEQTALVQAEGWVKPKSIPLKDLKKIN